MRVEAWLKSAEEVLEKSGIGTSRLDCLVLVEDVTKKNRAWLLAHPEFEIDKSVLSKLDALIRRRARHEPMAYIRGKTEFYGREFMVNKDVLEPRPESETMIELLKSLSAVKQIVDVGTGSGALAITAKLELPNTGVIAIDINKKCIEVAKTNAKKHEVVIDFYVGDLLEPITRRVDVALANLPYVPDDFKLNDAAMQEPRLAIFGGKDGLDIYRKMFAQIANFSQIPKFVLTESLPFQHQALARIATSAGYHQKVDEDFVQVFINSN